MTSSDSRPTDRKVTIHDVARRADVSLATVSYVLGGRRTVGEARRERVLEAIAALNYVPNRLAQGLRRGQSRLIGICLPTTTSGYFSQLTEQLEGLAARAGYEVVQVLSHQDAALEHGRLAALFAHRLAGLLFVPSESPSLSFGLIERAAIPTVVLDRASGIGAFDEVTIDNRLAMRETLEKLVAFGHRRVLFIATFLQLVTTRHRIEALQAAQDAGELTAEVLARGDDPERFAASLTGILRGPAAPTAVICSNTVIGLWTIRVMQSLGLTWPNDVSLVIFEHPEWADVVQPQIAVVEHPTGEMAALAWTLLTERMADAASPPRRIELKASLLLRSSLGPAAG